MIIWKDLFQFTLCVDLARNFTVDLTDISDSNMRSRSTKLDGLNLFSKISEQDHWPMRPVSVNGMRFKLQLSTK